MKSKLAQRAEKMNIHLSEEQLNQFEKYRNLIEEWNEKIDITAIIDEKEIDEKHFIDSLSIFRALPSLSTSGVDSEALGSSPGEFNHKIPGVDQQPIHVIDIGTGGGFPGIPMKIFNPSIHLTLLDSLNKRVQFLDTVIEELGLTNTVAIHARAEEAFREEAHRDHYDIAVSRAVASFPTLLEYCLPSVKVGGQFIAMKGPNAAEEIQKSKPALDALGGKIINVDEFEWTESNYQRTLITVNKVSPTPKKYPRGQGKPRKAPLELKN